MDTFGNVKVGHIIKYHFDIDTLYIGEVMEHSGTYVTVNDLVVICGDATIQEGINISELEFVHNFKDMTMGDIRKLHPEEFI